MFTVLLSGGSGKRLWPLSNELRSKQYLKLITKENSNSEHCSMVQRVWSQLEECKLTDNAMICASTGQVEILKNQLGDVQIATEPNRRDTFPAVALSCAYAKTHLGAKDDDVICILPVDPYTELSFFKLFLHLEKALLKSDADIALIGAKPTYPSSKYGYIIPSSKNEDYIHVEGFKEKPTEEEATKLIESGSLWNCGVFCFKIKRVLDQVKKYGLSDDYSDMYHNYEKLPKISFDYEVLEKAKNLIAVEFDGFWKDLGTWNTLTEQMDSHSIGNVVSHPTCENTHIINELNIPVVAMGTKDLIIAATFDGILVSDKHQSSYLKECTDQLNNKPMYEERRWGTLKTIDCCSNTLTRKINIYEGLSSSYHYHQNRDEIWTILKGTGEFVIENEKKQIQSGDILKIPQNTKHAVKANTNLEFMEIHIGTQIGDTDINRITFDWKEIIKNCKGD